MNSQSVVELHIYYKYTLIFAFFNNASMKLDTSNIYVADVS